MPDTVERPSSRFGQVEAGATIGPGADQRRLTEPDERRVRTVSPGADVLVSLSRGLAGKGVKHTKTARCLGLRRWGDQALLRHDDLGRMGMAFHIRHLVAITFLPHEVSPGADALAPPRHAVPSDRGTAPDWSGLVKTVDLVPGHGIEGGYFEFEHEEYLQMEVSKTNASVQWSTALEAKTFVQKMLKVAGTPPSVKASYLVYFDGRVEDDLDSRLAVAAVQAEGSDLRLFTVAYQDSAVSWRSPSIKLRNGSIPHVELSMSVSFDDLEDLLTLIQQTATPAVRRNLDSARQSLLQFIGAQAKGR